MVSVALVQLLVHHFVTPPFVFQKLLTSARLPPVLLIFWLHSLQPFELFVQFPYQRDFNKCNATCANKCNVTCANKCNVTCANKCNVTCANNILVSFTVIAAVCMHIEGGTSSRKYATVPFYLLLVQVVTL